MTDAGRLHNRGMAAPDRFDHLRHAALDMLDAGNSMASVSQLLAVPVTVVERWRQEPVPPRPPRRTVRQSSDGQGRGLRFSTTLVVRRGFPNGWMRHVAVGYVLSALAVGLIAWSLNHPGSLAEMLEVDVTSLIACAWWWFQRHRPLLTLTSDEIIVHEFLGSLTMPYADLADWWLVMHILHEGKDEEVEGRLLTLHSRGARKRPIELFVRDHVEFYPEVAERLDAVKQANKGPGPLTRM